MGWDVLAALGRFLRAAVAHYGVYEEAEEGQTAHTLETGSSNGRGIIHLQYDEAEKGQANATLEIEHRPWNGSLTIR
jgi:hypothetical protein